MAINIYFDNERLNDLAIMSLSQSGKLFDESFKLGATLCRNLTLQVNVEYVTNENPRVVKIYEGEVLKFTLHVDSVDKIDELIYSYVLVDSMIDLNIPLNSIFDWKPNTAYTVQQIVNYICDYIGSSHPTIEYIGSLQVSWDWTTIARDFLSYVAEINGQFVRITASGDAEFVSHKTAPTHTLDVVTCADITIGEYHKIERIGYEQGAASIYYPSGEVEHDTVYINENNTLITDSGGFTRQGIIEHIYSKVSNFEFYSLSTSLCEVAQDCIAGDNLLVSNVENLKLITTDGKYLEDEYGRKLAVAIRKGLPTIAQFDWTYNLKWKGGYSLDVNTARQEETSVKYFDNKVKSIKITVDRELGKITQKVTEVDTKVDTVQSELQGEIDDTNSNLDKYKLEVTETYSTKEQTATAITAEVTAIKTVIEGDVEQKYATKASLSLYVTEDEVKTDVVSWINASADNIILNTKKLIFGEYPNGQYIEVTNFYESNQATGVLFNGTGKIKMTPSGEIRFQNKDKDSNTIWNEIVAFKTNDHNRIVLQNRDSEGSIANTVFMDSNWKYDGSHTNTRIARLYNNCKVNNYFANNLDMVTDDTISVVILSNALGKYRGNLLWFNCGDSYAYSELSNGANVEGGTFGNKLRLETTESQTVIKIENFDYNKHSKSANLFSFVSRDDGNNITLRNSNCGNTNNANLLQISSDRSTGENKMLLQNYDDSGSSRNWLYMKRKTGNTETILYNKHEDLENYIWLSSANGIIIKNSYSCSLSMNRLQNIKLEGPNSVDINSTNYQVHINAPQGVFINGNKIG